MYKANVRKILTEGEGDKLKAVGVQLADGRTYRGQVDIVHNALLAYCLQVGFDIVICSTSSASAADWFTNLCPS